MPPWKLVTRASEIVRELLLTLRDGYAIRGEIVVHKTVVVEQGAALKGPLIIGPDCFVASGACLRGGCWVGIFGPGAELKTSSVFDRTKRAHFNFVGDSVLGAGVKPTALSPVSPAGRCRRR